MSEDEEEQRHVISSVRVGSFDVVAVLRMAPAIDGPGIDTAVIFYLADPKSGRFLALLEPRDVRLLLQMNQAGRPAAQRNGEEKANTNG